MPLLIELGVMGLTGVSLVSWGQRGSGPILCWGEGCDLAGGGSLFLEDCGLLESCWRHRKLQRLRTCREEGVTGGFWFVFSRRDSRGGAKVASEVGWVCCFFFFIANDHISLLTLVAKYLGRVCVG